MRDWLHSLDARYATRNKHAYGVLSMVCATAVRDELLQRNPCQIEGAMSVKPKKHVPVLSISEVHAIADKLATEDSTARYRALVLLAAWCGLRFGEVTELRRKDVELGQVGCVPDSREVVPVALRITRAVTHKDKVCRIADTKTGEVERIVTIPPHIAPDVASHLARFVGKSADSLLFPPARHGCHLHNGPFARILAKAADSVGRQDISAHSLRHFGGTVASQAGATARETQARLGHSTVAASMTYQHANLARDTRIAKAMSDMAVRELQG